MNRNTTKEPTKEPGQFSTISLVIEAGSEQLIIMSNMFTGLKIFCQLSFYLLFLGFSYQSVVDFVEGKVVFQLFLEKQEYLTFPDITFCPRQNRSLSYLKTVKLKDDFNLSSSDVKRFSIFMFLRRNINITSILEDYSFTPEESILKNSFM